MQYLRKRYKHFNRYREIANVLVKHGFGYMLNYLGMAEFLKYSRKSRVEDNKVSPVSKAERMRLVMEELGPTFIKLGQLLSTRSDMLPQEYITELSRLQEQVPAFSFSEVKERVQMELGYPVKDLFHYFEKEPMAAASIGQVHRALLENGDKVVVKVQRPGIQKVMSVDIEILYDLAAILERHTWWGKNYGLAEVVGEFDHMLNGELNYTSEGKNAGIFDTNFKQDKNLIVPRVYWDYTTSKILTMQQVDSIKLNDWQELDKSGLNGTMVAQELIDVMLKQIFVHGFFHADPHPGNLGVLSGGEIIMMDFGIVGRLDEEDREKIANLVLGIINRNTSSVVRAITSLGVVPGNIDFNAFRKEVEKLRKKYFEIPLKDISVSESLGEVMKIAYKYNISVRTDFTMLVKALVTLEGITSKLDPELSIVEATKPLGKKIMVERYSLEGLRRALGKNIFEYHTMFSRLPGQFNYLMDLVTRGELTFKAENPGMNIVIKHLYRLINRLSLSIVTAGLIIASALLSGKNITFLDMPVEQLSLGGAALTGTFFVVSLFRSP